MTDPISRLAEVPSLGMGTHTSIHDGACALEAASYVAEEEWSDQPNCVCRVIGSMLRNWNDSLPKLDRDRLLRPLILPILHTRRDVDVEQRRGLIAADWIIRHVAPAWLRVAGAVNHAAILSGLPEIVSDDQWAEIGPMVKAIHVSLKFGEIDWNETDRVPQNCWDVNGMAEHQTGVNAAYVATIVARVSSGHHRDSSNALEDAISVVRCCAWAATFTVNNADLAKLRHELEQSAVRMVCRMIVVDWPCRLSPE